MQAFFTEMYSHLKYQVYKENLDIKILFDLTSIDHHKKSNKRNNKIKLEFSVSTQKIIQNITYSTAVKQKVTTYT